MARYLWDNIALMCVSFRVVGVRVLDVLCSVVLRVKGVNDVRWKASRSSSWPGVKWCSGQERNGMTTNML